MNVYDFDETIFYPNSTFQFIKYCLRKHPHLIFRYAPRAIGAFHKYLYNKSTKNECVAEFCQITTYLKNPEKDIKRFWKRYERNLSPWYLLQRKPDDLIISASPSFMIEPIAEKLGVKCVCTQMDIKTGEVKSEFCYGKEKARVIIGMDMPMIDNFYSDSLSDTPIALLAEKAYIVKDKANVVEPWPHIGPKLFSKAKRKTKVGKFWSSL